MNNQQPEKRRMSLQEVIELKERIFADPEYQAARRESDEIGEELKRLSKSLRALQITSSDKRLKLSDDQKRERRKRLRKIKSRQSRLCYRLREINEPQKRAELEKRLEQQIAGIEGCNQDHGSGQPGSGMRELMDILRRCNVQADQTVLPAILAEWDPGFGDDYTEVERVLELPFRGYSATTYAIKRGLPLNKRQEFIIALKKECFDVSEILRRSLKEYSHLPYDQRQAFLGDFQTWCTRFVESVEQMMLSGNMDSFESSKTIFDFCSLVQKETLMGNLYLEHLTGMCEKLKQTVEGELRAKAKQPETRKLAGDLGGGAGKQTDGTQTREKPHAKIKKKKTPAQLLKQTKEKMIKDLLDQGFKQAQVANKMECSKSTISRSDSWGKYLQKEGNRPPKGFKRSRSTKGPDTESIGDSPQSVHRDIKEMIDHSKKISGAPPPATAIMEKLSLVDEKETERLIRDTLHFFPELTDDSTE